jgi:hypothetical protein
MVGRCRLRRLRLGNGSSLAGRRVAEAAGGAVSPQCQARTGGLAFPSGRAGHGGAHRPPDAVSGALCQDPPGGAAVGAPGGQGTHVGSQQPNTALERPAHSARFFTHGRLYMWAAAQFGRLI